MITRVNHKSVKQRLNEKRSNITDRQFFTSRLLARHFEAMAEVQTHRYNYYRRVRVVIVWEPDNPETACTDNRLIWINAGNKMVTGVKGRENRYQIVCGLFAHELGHILYTDFLASQTHDNYLKHLRWFPEPPLITTSADKRREEEFWEYVKLDEKNADVVVEVSHHISNVLEDGYIENRMLNNFPGTLGCGLEDYRALQFSQMPTVTQLKEKEDEGQLHIAQSILQIILSYAKFGEIKYGDEPMSDVRIKTVFSLLDDIDDALKIHSGKKRLGIGNIVLIRCWDYLKEYCELCKQRHEEAQKSDLGASLSKTVADMLKGMAGGSSIGTGNSVPVPEKDDEEENSATAKSRAGTKSDSKTENSEQEAATANAGGSGGGTSGNNSGEGVIGGETNAADNNEPLNVSETEKGRIPLKQTTEVSVPEDGTEKHTEYKRQNYERAAADIERILNKMAEKAACSEMENERLRELNEFAQSISYGNIHSGVNIRINRITEVDDDLIEQYNAISAPLINISRQLKKQLVKQLTEKRRGGKQTGLLMGRRLDTHSIHRNDGKVFYKNTLPNETPELSVALLLDESGSMQSCDRCTYARAAAIILYDFCQSLNIPIVIYGHSTGSGRNGKGSVELYSYVEFDSYDNNDKHRLMDISARSCNRDGAPLRYTAERLVKRPEEVKILIYVSDGQPADSGYYGTAAEEDLRGIKKEYQRKGILFVAAAIGDDKENIQRIYGDSFMDITDLNQLPVKLTSVVKRHIRV